VAGLAVFAVRVSKARQQHPERDYPDAENKVQPVVRAVDGDEVGHALLVDDEPVDPQHQVDHASADQERSGGVGRASHRDACDAEEQVHDVVQDRNVEQPDQLGSRLVTGEGERVVVGGHTRNETENADEEEHRTDCHRAVLNQRAVGE